TGRHGQISRSLLERCQATSIEILTIARPQFDLAHPDGVEAALSALQADAVVSAAAYTAVDLAEGEPDVAHKINGGGAGAVASAAAALDIPIVHLSTDYVFDGLLERPYRE